MVRLTERRRAILAEKFGDLANLGVAALVFGQVVGQEAFSTAIAIAGFLIWLVFMAAMYFAAGESE